MRTPHLTTCVASLALACAFPGTAAGAVSPEQAISFLNAQRAQHGLPAGIVENRDWSEKCAQHMLYLEHNGYVDGPHHEDPNKPYYTEGGAEAGRNSLIGGAYGPDGRNPFEFAPLHVVHTLDPALSVVGYAPGCIYLQGGQQRGSDTAALYTYPAAGTNIYPEMIVYNETPFAPSEFVGISQGTPTGPHLYVLAHGPEGTLGRIESASLVGPHGPVEVRTVDNTTRSERGDLGGSLPAGGIMIPVQPLAENSDYTASASVVTDAGQQLTATWGFRTTTSRLQTADVSITVRRDYISVLSDSTAPLTLRVLRLPSRTEVLRKHFADATGPTDVKHRLPGGRYSICVDQPRSDDYRAVRFCKRSSWRASRRCASARRRSRARTRACSSKATRPVAARY